MESHLNAISKPPLLTIAAASHRETAAILREASEIGASPVVILTHAFEFIHGPMSRSDSKT